MQLLSTSQVSPAPGRPSLPSPTLTNPDMILPYDSPSRDSTTDGGSEMKGAMRKIFRNGERSKSNKGMDDINGAESRDTEHGRSGTSVLAPSPTFHDEFAISGSGAAYPREGYWNGFDSAQGGGPESPDDEPADFKFMGPPTYSFPSLDNEKDGFSAPPEMEDDDAYSHAAMSIRAEQILANAKKRLTNMEGNLNRARSTLHNRPSSSMSSFSNRGPGPVSLYSLSKGSTPPSKHRQMNSPPSATNMKGHSRVFSETSVPSSLQTHERPVNETQTARSSSAMGSASRDTSGDSMENSHNWFWTGLQRNTSYAHRHNYQLPALEEDEPATESVEASPSAENHIKEVENEDEVEEAASNPVVEAEQPARSPKLHLVGSPGLTRARSTTQMRDLRDQMQDLKGKISSLKRRAREDSMRRRSMQSLRTPSPFTAAENWYGDEPGFRQGSPKVGNGIENNSADEKHQSRESDETFNINKGPANEASQSIDESFEHSEFDLSPRNTALPMKSISSDDSQAEESIETPTKASLSGSSTESLAKENRHGTEDHMRDLDLESRQEDTDSLYGDQDYHDTSPSPVGERHEDRPDAFDYETFFLHSGTGTLARKAHSRASSHSSKYSVETTKPTYTLTDTSRERGDDTDSSSAEATPKRATSRQKERGHVRNDSGESISTVATFATATEGKGSDGEGDEDEWIHRPMAGAWRNDQSSKRKISPRSLGSPSSDLARSGSSSGNKRAAPFRKLAPAVNGIDPIPVPIPSVPAHHLDHTPLSPSSTSLAVLSREAAQMSEGDKKLVEMLVNSLSKVCVRLKEGGEENGRYEGRVWRRRLDTSRRVLDGEMNGEAF